MNTVWWQGGLMEIKARAEDTGGASDTWVWQPRGVPQSFKVESESARALVIFTPGGLERMFEGRRRARLVPAGIRPAATVSYDSETGLKAPNAADVQRRR